MDLPEKPELPPQMDVEAHMERRITMLEAEVERLKVRLGFWTKAGDYIQAHIRLLLANQPMGPQRREMLTEWAEMIEAALRGTKEGV